MTQHKKWSNCNPISRSAVLQKLKAMGDRAGVFGEAARAAHEVLSVALNTSRTAVFIEDAAEAWEHKRRKGGES